MTTYQDESGPTMTGKGSDHDADLDDVDGDDSVDTATGVIGVIDVGDVPGVPGVPDTEPGAARADVANPPDSRPDAEQLARERARLIDLLVYAWDRARSPGVWERLTVGLAEVGVTVLRPDGEPFDPNRHEVGGVEPTDEDALVDTVAETEVAGFSDRGRVLREPIVVVRRRS